MDDQKGTVVIDYSHLTSLCQKYIVPVKHLREAEILRIIREVVHGLKHWGSASSQGQEHIPSHGRINCVSLSVNFMATDSLVH